MQVPLEITYRDVQKTDTLDELIREKVKSLERMCDYITSCSIAVERPNDSVKNGNPYRVRIDMKVPPKHELVVTVEPGQSEKDDPLPAIIRDSFEAAKKQLKKLVEMQREDVKKHPEQEVTAIVSGIFPGEGYGFLTTIDGREIYFHKNSLVNDQFENIKVGDGARFFEVQGEKGPQASTVLVIDQSPVV